MTNKTKSKLEAMDEVIEAMAYQVASHSEVKPPNTYIALARVLLSYSKRCLELSEQELKRGEPQNGNKQPSKRNPMGKRGLPWKRSENGK